ncbi:PAP2 family phosphoesterase [Steroidobacter agaridevorans]|uniref:PAP2 family phosphoesterase n=2 Tax=Steroidobacter agaridevorans TaxID=2695856 RepID=A0A829YDW2_9GAMM|nr:PAP2 family phosphoesterase [Steroidobacter agaridevorans]GFE88982.1 PAP2 family phosphoesterase [Steroidobacter agaridevorans]
MFYWRHVRAPLVMFVVLAALLASTSLDISIAHALYFDEAHSRWLGATSWWTNELIHRDGAWLMRSVAALALGLWIATWVHPQLHELRRPALYFFVSIVLSVGLVGLLKSLTNVDCPRDLTEFGGAFPFIHLFEHRPAALRHARCFPAAHASSGYALLALYFVLRERSRIAARFGLAAGLAMGLVFGIAQQSRGAHFVSHDVWSAMLVWTVSLSLYTFAFKARLWNAAPPRSQWECNEVSAAARRLPVDGTVDVPPSAGATAGP